MKKWMTLALTLLMALSMTITAFAATPSPTADNITFVTSEDGQRQNLLVYRIKTTDETKKLTDEFLLAYGEGNVFSVFPEEIEIDPNAIILDIISLTATKEAANHESYTILIKGAIGILKDHPAYAVIKADDNWMQPQAEAAEDDILRVTFDKDMLKKMADAKNISLVILRGEIAE
jgi:hypothetical protein